VCIQYSGSVHTADTHILYSCTHYRYRYRALVPIIPPTHLTLYPSTTTTTHTPSTYRYRYRALVAVAKTGDALARKREAVAASGGDAGGADVAWNQSARQLAATSNSHLYYFMLSKFAEVCRTPSPLSPPLSPTLSPSLTPTSSSHSHTLPPQVCRGIEDDACRSGMILSPYTHHTHHALTIHSPYTSAPTALCALWRPKRATGRAMARINLRRSRRIRGGGRHDLMPAGEMMRILHTHTCILMLHTHAAYCILHTHTAYSYRILATPRRSAPHRRVRLPGE
jgi:hypothetical protein